MGHESSSFIVSPEDVARVERRLMSPKELVWKELEADYRHYFSDRAKVITEKILSDMPVSGDDRAIFDRERNAWWQDKYGFPYERGAERNEVIARKYMVEEDLVHRRDLQIELFETVRNNDLDKLRQLRSRYEAEYPDQLEGVDVLLEFPAYVDLQRQIQSLPRIARSHEEKEAKKEIFQSLTEYHFLISHFVEQNGDDKNFLEKFWGIMEELGATQGNLRQVQIMRSGVLSQVAALKIFEQLGQHPKLSHPDQDAFDAIDMWTDGDVAVQIKTGRNRDDELLLDADDVAFPGVQMNDADGSTRIVNTDLMHDVARFHTKSSAYGDRIGKKVSGYYAVIPKQTYDHVTGNPSEEIVRRFATNSEYHI